MNGEAIEIASASDCMSALQLQGGPFARPIKIASAPKVTQNLKSRCRCNGKGTCVDCKRWDEIFARKFDFPAYYTTFRIRWESAFPQRCQF